ncbi:hypothetical protein IG193_02345 [Infirmifilum lucidum]|uniref:NADH:quinone oxidoreductase/Mrp antiporter transmembrane domain-containing protein n=1 Tax=Infirmifilum lucidum TaxID=2776706 RepID=A0A7L9FK56_9CREN|nr:proton-conducting transporter membrane subunit [Infirmifilum lucidum]QOJ79324.1 hypothetical protein IG193_02345 [Infirmifilum lucidum]
MFEELVVYTALSGGLLLVLARAARGRVRRALSTAIAACALAFLLQCSILERSPAGLIGLTSSLIGLVAVLSAYSLVDEDVSAHNALILALCSSSVLLATSTDLIRLFMAWEILSASVVALTAYHRDREGAEAAMKYVMLCGAGTALALSGVTLVVVETGSTSLEAVYSASPLAKVLLLTGFGVEAAIFPLHFWLPDAHMAAPSTASAVLSGVAIESAAVLVFRLVGSDAFARAVVAPLALAGALVGNFSAYRQDDLKRLLAFSSVANVNYILLAWASGNALATKFAFLHIFAHGLLKASLFIVAGVLLTAYGTRLLSKLSGAASKNNALRLTVVFAALGLTGAPPLPTFWSELYIGVGLFQYSTVLGLGFLLSVVVSFAYYFRVMYTLVTGSREGGLRENLPVILALTLIVVGIAASPIYSTIIEYFSI